MVESVTTNLLLAEVHGRHRPGEFGGLSKLLYFDITSAEHLRKLSSAGAERCLLNSWRVLLLYPCLSQLYTILAPVVMHPSSRCLAPGFWKRSFDEFKRLGTIGLCNLI